MRFFRLFVFFILSYWAIHATDAAAQRVAKYGADFLAGGVGARALAMGGAYISVAEDVYAGYWNPAGLSSVSQMEASYMHAERFSGVVSFDYAGFAMPFSERSVFGISLIRSGVNDIKNTLDAWDSERNQPKSNPEDFITTFSAADYAIMFSYGKQLNERWSVGATSKIIHRSIGDFATAWGYSMDFGVQLEAETWRAGATLQDATTMLQSWSVNAGSLSNIRDVFGDDLPEGGTELVLPVLRLGFAKEIPLSFGGLLVALDTDLAFDNYVSNAFSIGKTSIYPRLGMELNYDMKLFLRGGFNRIQQLKDSGLDLTPSIGAGFLLGSAAVDYGFGDFAGIVSDLGYSHRVSIKYGFGQDD
jgi:hypothetical protein